MEFGNFQGELMEVENLQGEITMVGNLQGEIMEVEMYCFLLWFMLCFLLFVWWFWAKKRAKRKHYLGSSEYRITKIIFGGIRRRRYLRYPLSNTQWPWIIRESTSKEAFLFLFKVDPSYCKVEPSGFEEDLGSFKWSTMPFTNKRCRLPIRGC